MRNYQLLIYNAYISKEWVQPKPLFSEDYIIQECLMSHYDSIGEALLLSAQI